MKRVAAGAVIVLIGWFFLPGTADAGWVIHSRGTGPDGRVGKEVLFFQQDRIRADAEDSAHVMDFVSRKIIMIDYREKTYSVMTFEEFKKMFRENIKVAHEAMEEMKRQGISMPEPPLRPRGKVTVSRLTGATIAGYGCDGYRVSVGGEPREDIWVTKEIDVWREIGPAMWREFVDLSREMKAAGLPSDDEEESAEYRKIAESGYPMKVVDKQSGHVEEVTGVERKAIAVSLFEEPYGYEKVPYDRMMYGSSEGIPSSGKRSPWQEETIQRDAERSREEEASADTESGGVGGKVVDYGKQSAEEAKDAATRGAKEPVQEQKREILDSIREGTREGIKKLFKW